MKAIVLEKYGSIDNLQYKDEIIAAPKAGELLIKVLYAAVNPFDRKVIEGMGESLGFTLPLIPGSELSGIVEKTGAGVINFKPGDAVFGNLSVYGGCYAPFAIVKEKNVVKKPEGISFEIAASASVGASTSWKAIFDTADLQSGQKILIHGASGGVGSLAVQLAKLKQAYVIATASGESETFVKSLGANVFIDYKNQSFVDMVKDVDVVLDTVGGDTQEQSFKVLKEGGVLVSLVQPPSKELAAKYKVKAEMIFNEPNVQRLSEISKLLEEGKLKISVEKIFPLSEATAALALLRSGHRQGKILLQPKKSL